MLWQTKTAIEALETKEKERTLSPSETIELARLKENRDATLEQLHTIAAAAAAALATVTGTPGIVHIPPTVTTHTHTHIFLSVTQVFNG